MPSLGEKLRRARLEQGLEIAELAARTKIGARFLDAIENNRREEIPAGFFFRNWTSQYASALSLSEKEIQGDVDAILESEAPLPLPGQATAASKELPRVNRNLRRRGGVPRLMLSFGLLVVVVLGCSGLYSWWHNRSELSSTASANVPEEPVPAHPRAEPRKVAAAPAPVHEASARLASTSEALLLDLYAREQTWLTISPDGRQTFSGVLEANESKRVEAHESARIKIGNAGGLDVRLNGKPVGEIGPKGKVRVLLVGPDGIHIFQQSKSAAAALLAWPLDGGPALPLALE